jgi:hypothetical protein
VSNRSKATLFDHLVGKLLEMQGHLKAEGFGGLEIDRECVLRRLLDRKVARLK